MHEITVGFQTVVTALQRRQIGGSRCQDQGRQGRRGSGSGGNRNMLLQRRKLSATRTRTLGMTHATGHVQWTAVTLLLSALAVHLFIYFRGYPCRQQAAQQHVPPFRRCTGFGDCTSHALPRAVVGDVAAAVRKTTADVDHGTVPGIIDISVLPDAEVVPRWTLLLSAGRLRSICWLKGVTR